MMARHRLTDEQWELIKDLMPPPAKTGRPRGDLRKMVDAALWIAATGAPWRDLPEEFGPWQTAWEWFNRWSRNGTWKKILQRLQARCQQQGQIDQQLWCMDGTVVRAARCAAGGGKKGIRKSQKIML